MATNQQPFCQEEVIRKGEFLRTRVLWQSVLALCRNPSFVTAATLRANRWWKVWLDAQMKQIILWGLKERQERHPSISMCASQSQSQEGNPSLATVSQWTSSAEVSISRFRLTCWKLCVCATVYLCVRDYMVCVSVCARVCVCGCWKICYLEWWILMTFVNSNTQSCPAVDKTEVFSACFEFI